MVLGFHHSNGIQVCLQVCKQSFESFLVLQIFGLEGNQKTYILRPIMPLYAASQYVEPANK